MTSVHNASLDAGASSADLTVSMLEPLGVLAEVECLVSAKTTTNGKYLNLARVPANESVVVYPTSETIRVTNISGAAGIVEVNAK